MKPWNDYWYGFVSPLRSWLLIRATLLLLAFDAWIVMGEHGGRYGIGEFNVAHVAVLDGLQPVPTPALYVGLLMFIGLLAFATAFSGVNRYAVGAICVLYTYAWSMSMLDSYQHHYLLSLLLASFAFVPPITLEAATQSERSSANGPQWAYGLAVVSCAIVYGYTALHKTEAEWINGVALQRIAPERMAPVRDFAVGLGLDDQVFWSLMGVATVVVQVLICIAYLIAPIRDRKHRILEISSWVGLATALSFHVGAELLDLRVGWFSYYMVLIAFIAFLPETMLRSVGRVLTLPLRTLDRFRQEEPGIGLTMGWTFGVAVVVAYLGRLVDLPGAAAAGLVSTVALVIGCAALGFVARTRLVRTWTLAALAGSIAMAASIALSDVRFDYYRYVAGDARRRGEVRQAYEAYRKANRYAPSGKNRRDEEEEMRRRLSIGDP